jgi:hypothetical protein
MGFPRLGHKAFLRNNLEPGPGGQQLACDVRLAQLDVGFWFGPSGELDFVRPRF